jgi:conjugal transfer mating pair stabilization protein TraG
MKKAKFIFILLISVSTNLFAVDPSIFTWGYGEIFYKVLQGVTIISQEKYLVTSALAVGGLLLMIRNISNNGNSSDIAFAMGKYLVIVTLILGLFVEATKRYIIEDEITGQTFIVNNVPVGIGETFSLFTTLEKNLAKGFEIAFATPNSIAYSKVGLGFTMSAPLEIKEAKITDAYLVRTFNEYMDNCVLNAIIAGDINSNILQNSKNLKNDLRVTGYLTPLYTASNPYGVDKVCEDAWDAIKADITTQLTNLETLAAAKANVDQTTFNSGMTQTSNLLFGISQSASDYLMQQTLINLTNSGLQAIALATGGDASALGYAKALSEENQKQTWVATGVLAKQNLPLMKAIMTILILGSFYLLVLLSVIYGDLGHVKMGFTLLFAMVLWTPLAILINGMMNIAIERIVPIISNGGLNLANNVEISSELQNYLAILGYIAASIPIFAYSIAKKSEHGFVSLFGGVGAASSSAASSATSQTSTGNLSAGNTRLNSFNATDMYGAHDYAGASAWKRNFISSHGTNRNEYTSGSGNGLVNTDAGGIADMTIDKQSGQVTKVANSTLSVGTADGISQMRQQSIQETQQYSDAFSSAFANQFARSINKGEQGIDTTTLTHNYGQSIEDKEAFNKATNESIQQTLTDMVKNGHNLTFSSNTGVNAGANASISMGTPEAVNMFGGFKIRGGLDGGISLTGTTSDGKDYSIALTGTNAQSFMTSFTENQSKSIGNNESLSKALATQAQATYGFGDSETLSKADSYTRAYQESKALSDAYSLATRHDINLNEDILPKVVNRFIDRNEELSTLREQGVEGAVRASEIAVAMMRNDSYRSDVISALNDVTKTNFDTSSAKDAGIAISIGKDSIDNKRDNYVEGSNSVVAKVAPVVQDVKDNLEHTKPLVTKEQIENGYVTQSKEFYNRGKDDIGNFKERNLLNTKEHIVDEANKLKTSFEKSKDDIGIGGAFKNNPMGGKISDMLGTVGDNLGEPGAIIGLAGASVIKQNPYIQEATNQTQPQGITQPQEVTRELKVAQEEIQTKGKRLTELRKEIEDLKDR